MHDQADELRQLVLRNAAQNLAPSAPAPYLVAVSGGKGGVGTTTVAVNLTVALMKQGQRAVLVDADLAQPDATSLCGLSDGDTVADVLSGRRTVHEVLQRGPAGIQVLPGAWAPPMLPDCSPLAQQRMLSELARIGAHADVVVLDVGNGLDPVVGRFWQAADMIVLVTTPESTSIMDAYASIKVLAGDRFGGQIRTLVNRAHDESEAVEVNARIGQACARFLQREVHTAPFLREDGRVGEAAERRQPFLLTGTAPQPASALEALGEQIVGQALGRHQGRAAS